MSKIEFNCSDQHVLKYFPVKPARDCLPDWYSKLKATEPNISKCMPVRDMITAGYIIPNAYEQVIGYETDSNTGEEDVDRIYPVEEIGEFYRSLNKMTAPHTVHTHSQCPVKINGKKKSYFKINLPWQVKTPKGYSCLFFQPFYQFQDDIAVMPGIIDTDEFDLNQLNFPCYLNNEEAHLTPGRPLVQLIPFKRDNWEHTLNFVEPSTSSKMNLFLHNMYKRAFHKRKTFK